MRSLLRRFRRRPRALSVPRAVAEKASDHLLEMDEALEAIAGLDGLDELVETRRVPEQLFPLWRDALRAYDRYLETMLDGAAASVRCTVGCAACCQREPVASPLELLAIYAAYRDLEDHGGLRDEMSARADTGKSSGPCVFLDAAGRCRVYDDRPLMCRMHFSTSEPSWCASDHPRANDAVTLDVAPPEAIGELLRRIATQLRLEDVPQRMFSGLVQIDDRVVEHARLGVSPKAKRRRRAEG